MRHFVLVALTGCSATVWGGSDPPNTSSDASGPRADAGDHNGTPLPDAAAPLRLHVTLSQTATTAITSQTTPACWLCNNTTNPCTNYATYEGSWYRVFDLADHGITKPFHVEQITFAVLQSMGTVAVDVKLGVYNGTPGTTLDPTLVTPLASTVVSVPPMTYYTPLPAPLQADVQPGTKLIAEVHAPDYHGMSNVYFFIGGTTQGDVKPAYARWPACNKPAITSMPALGFPNENIILTITGSYEL